MSATIEVPVRITAELYAKVLLRAGGTETSFDSMVARALEREVSISSAPVPASSPSEIIDIYEVSRMLRLSVWTIRRRARKPGDPLRLARSRMGKQKPMHFYRSKIEMAERGR